MTTAALFLALLVTTGAEAGRGPQILDFHAEWCGPCRAMRPKIKSLIQKGYPVRSIDVDEQPELARKYGVTSYPTFLIVDAGGRELARTKGFQEESNLAALYDKAKARPGPRRESERPDDETVADSRRDRAPSDDGAPIPRPWQTVVRIKVHNPSRRSIGFGSGTIIYSDEDESIILTCAHIFHIDGRREQPHPKRFPLKITVDLFDGKIRSLKPAQVHPIGTEAGEAIDYNFTSDVGLIRIRPGRKLPASPVAPADWRPRRGMEMITVGCSEGNDATAWSTQIESVQTNTIDGRPHHAIVCGHAPLVGRSGGGLYTKEGYLVGVCDFADRANNVGLYASPTSIHRLLDRNQLMALYRSPGADAGARLASSAAPRNNRAAEPSKLRTQSPSEPGGRGLSLPEPEMVGVRVPDRDDAKDRADRPQIASSPWRAGAGSGGGVPVRTVAQDRARAGFGDPTPRRGQVRRPVVEPAEAETTDLKMEPSAADPIDAVKDVPAPRPEPREVAAHAPSDGWRAARRSRPPGEKVEP